MRFVAPIHPIIHKESMQLKLVSQLKEESLDKYTADLKTALKKEEARKEDGSFGGEKYADVVNLPSKNPVTYDEKVTYLTNLIKELNLLDMEDYFGTEGWRHRFMGED